LAVRLVDGVDGAIEPIVDRFAGRLFFLDSQVSQAVAAQLRVQALA
jgi:hypothetical protein